MPPAGGPPPHRHDFDEGFVVLEGELEVLCGAETRTLKAGDRAFAPRGVPHTFHNATGAPATFLGIATPGGHEAFFEDAARIEGPLDPAAAVAVCERHGIELLF